MSATEISQRTMVDEWTGEERTIVRRCQRCEHAVKWYPGVFGVVSPKGIEHVGLTGGATACGHDATADGWLWPL